MKINALEEKLSKIIQDVGGHVGDLKQMLNFSKLFSNSEDVKILTHGAISISLAFLDKHTPPLLQKKAIKLTNLYCSKINHLNENLGLVMIHNIENALENLYSDKADHVKMLEILDSLKNIPPFNKSQPGLSSFLGNRYESASLYMRIKIKVIRKIIESPWINHHSLTVQEQNRIGITILEMLEFKDYGMLTLMCDNIKKIFSAICKGP
jgi:hypothetical protein